MPREPDTWSKWQKLEAVMRLFRGESLDDVSRDLGIEISRVEHWKTRALRGLEDGLREDGADAIHSALLEASRRIQELTAEVERLRRKIRRPGPGARRAGKRAQRPA